MKKSNIIIGVLVVALLWSMLYISELKDEVRAYKEGRTKIEYTLQGDRYFVRED